MTDEVTDQALLDQLNAPAQPVDAGTAAQLDAAPKPGDANYWPPGSMDAGRDNGPLTFGKMKDAFVKPFKRDADVALSMARSIVNGPAASVAGVYHAIMNTDGDWQSRYFAGKKAYEDEIAKGNTLVHQGGAVSPEGKEAEQVIAKGIDAVGGAFGHPFDNLGGVIDEKAGPAVTDIAKNAFDVLSFGRVPKVGRLPSVGGTPDAAVNAMRDNGYMVPPTTFAGRAPDAATANPGMATTATKLSGTSDLENFASLHNAFVTQQHAGEALGHEGPMTADTLQAAKRDANAAYDRIKGGSIGESIPVLPAEDNIDIMKRIADLAGDTSNPLNKGSTVDPKIKELQDMLVNQRGATIANVVDKARELSGASFKNAKAADTAGGEPLARLAKAQKEAADILNTIVDRYLQLRLKNTADPATREVLGRAYTDYVGARKKLATTIYPLEEGSNKTTGTVYAADITNAYNKGLPLSPALQRIADAGNTAPQAMKAPEAAARAGGANKADVVSLGFGGTGMLAGALTGGKMGGVAGGATGGAIGGLLGATAPLLVRLALSSYAKRAMRGDSALRSMGNAALHVNQAKNAVNAAGNFPQATPQEGQTNSGLRALLDPRFVEAFRRTVGGAGPEGEGDVRTRQDDANE